MNLMFSTVWWLVTNLTLPKQLLYIYIAQLQYTVVAQCRLLPDYWPIATPVTAGRTPTTPQRLG